MTGGDREIAAPARLVFTSAALDEESNALFEALTTVTLAEQDGKTQLTLRAAVTTGTAGAAPHLAGVEQGWSRGGGPGWGRKASRWGRQSRKAAAGIPLREEAREGMEKAGQKRAGREAGDMSRWRKMWRVWPEATERGPQAIS